MDALAIVFERPQELSLKRLTLVSPSETDVVVEIDFTGISSGTERLLWTGKMPSFPGMGYPLVPGYESVGRIVEAGSASGRKVGEHVFIAGAKCFEEARPLFGGAAQRLVAAGARVVPIDTTLRDRGILLALAATAFHAIKGGETPDLIIGHGVLGRLVARLSVVLGQKMPTVWETNVNRHSGAVGYNVCTPDDDERRDYKTICDVSGANGLLDSLITRLAPGGEIVLAGFYSDALSFQFAPAFQREARLRVAAQWQPGDLLAVARFAEEGSLSLDGLISHHEQVADAQAAYRTAFNDASCVKMVLDWRNCA
ncbi:MAG: chlorophyll synthesis pathway protein BchC [Gemmatimonadaceae bacterium]